MGLHPDRSINGEAAGQILDWYTEHGFYDMADIEEIIEADGSWYAKLLYDHSDQIAAGTGIYDPAEGQLYIKKEKIERALLGQYF